ncbi:FAD-dependent monooxygenase [Bailinhaonella thermotolerans]|uniref:FAD-dependent oxidoreductase n=1 Tax=Bailinhaonella thermotolerans TaxID=1070861 RepID=A0A3A4ATC0_9ACTN|nr:FAD-dependent monooxygenase [Bailinhaonella thermotolerans]RJL32613.1 FAD-dependent oxidoreductase [Bailinhaonella thermotolerans]
MTKKILISGAGIGGLALAHWLARYGHAVTVVEKAPAMRPGGQAVDFKGAAHLTVLERMGILEDVRRHATGGADLYFVDADGRRLGVMPGEFTGGDLEILRGDLARLLHDRVRDRADVVFGDSITSLAETPDGVRATFERAAPGAYDLVVGADGIHSNVRRLVFGPERDYVRHQGHYYALAGLDRDFGPDGLMYNEPGRLVSVGGNKAPAFFVFASPELEYDRYDPEAQIAILTRAYAGMGWRTAEVVEALQGTRDVYLDSISRVHMEEYTRGRVALLGDAGYGNTLGGFGSGLALVGAYVLAGELAAAGGDHRAAFRRYQEILLRYSKVARKGNAGPFLAPPTWRRIRSRNRLFRYRPMLKLMIAMGERFATGIDLRDYPVPAHR